LNKLHSTVDRFHSAVTEEHAVEVEQVSCHVSVLEGEDWEVVGTALDVMSDQGRKIARLHAGVNPEKSGDSNFNLYFPPGRSLKRLSAWKFDKRVFLVG
tara:strand:- start:1509 stop:1805 length:297 start_codon:yes stop_codon:yes gene_type:complete